MILIIPNIVQNLYLHLSMPLILGLHPPYPTSPTYLKPCYLNLPNPQPLIGLPLHPPPQIFFFFEFSQKLQFSVPIPPDLPQPDPLTGPPPPKKKYFFLNFHKSFTSPFTSTLTSPETRPPPPPPPTPPKKKKKIFLNFQTSFTSLFPSTLTPPPPNPTPPPDLSPPPPPNFFFLNLHRSFTSPHSHPP